MPYTACEMVWLKNLQMELDFGQPRPMPMHCNNQSATYIVKHPLFYNSTKHIEVDCYFVRYVRTTKVIAF